MSGSLASRGFGILATMAERRAVFTRAGAWPADDLLVVALAFALPGMCGMEENRAQSDYRKKRRKDRWVLHFNRIVTFPFAAFPQRLGPRSMARCIQIFQGAARLQHPRIKPKGFFVRRPSI